MRYEMRKFRVVLLFPSEFESNFQKLMKKIEEWEDPPEKEAEEAAGSIESFLLTHGEGESVFNSMCREYQIAAETDKRRRKSEWATRKGISDSSRAMKQRYP